MVATGKNRTEPVVGSLQVQVNGRPERLQAGTTIAQLLESMQLGKQRCAVEVNQQLVRRERHGSHELKDGDKIEVVTLVGGG
ncbi:MAG TPA: sulfur carrier protein ThiS [Planctomycetota bacterium]|nr:sulfur carrier protein ThiS [Planctomycetota bacterium]